MNECLCFELLRKPKIDNTLTFGGKKTKGQWHETNSSPRGQRAHCPCKKNKSWVSYKGQCHSLYEQNRGWFDFFDVMGPWVPAGATWSQEKESGFPCTWILAMAILTQLRLGHSPPIPLSWSQLICFLIFNAQKQSHWGFTQWSCG